MATAYRMAIDKSTQLEQLSKLFGSYKAEWLQDSIFELYSEPSYFPELTTPRPCVLNGGRGTGKTTVLRSLSYIGQWEITRRQTPDPAIQKSQVLSWPYYGFYYRVNTPRVSAFQGTELSVDEWQKLFLHYINIIFVQQLLKFLEWYSADIKTILPLDKDTLNTICLNLAVDEASSIEELSKKLAQQLINIESYINNIGIDPKPRVSSSGALDAIFSLISSLPEFKQKIFFIIIDEYENFRDEQQQVINTLLKHTSTSYTFKIGVKKLGWRIKNTLNENENLISPADYVLIDIADKLNENDFNAFAADVCNHRISKLLSSLSGVEFTSVKDMFPSLSMDEEATLLGVNEIASSYRDELIRLDENLKEEVALLSDLDLYTIAYLAKGQSLLLIDGMYDYIKNKESLAAKLDEYKYSALFTIRKGRSGIKKYYAGWDVLSKISCINIRYLLELVEQALLLHIKEDNILGTKISPKTQTMAAQAVGRKNLEELGGISIHGAKLTKLVLGLGRIFGVLAESSAGHTIEVNQFRIREERPSLRFIGDDSHPQQTATEIVTAAVMHLALVSFPANKPKDEGQTKDNIYQLHPIFAPYFIFSHRRRRDLVLSEDEILGLIKSPSDTIKGIMESNNRYSDFEAPQQLRLFSSYSEK